MLLLLLFLLLMSLLVLGVRMGCGVVAEFSVAIAVATPPPFHAQQGSNGSVEESCETAGQKEKSTNVKWRRRKGNKGGEGEGVWYEREKY